MLLEIITTARTFVADIGEAHQSPEDCIGCTLDLITDHEEIIGHWLGSDRIICAIFYPAQVVCVAEHDPRPAVAIRWPRAIY